MCDGKGAPVRLVAYLDENGVEAVGRLDGTCVHPLSGLERIDRAFDPEALAAAAAAGGGPGDEGVELDGLTLLPVARPERNCCVGLNYRSHVDETGRDLPSCPVLFPKFASSPIGHGAPITLPPESTQADCEAQPAVVIGKPGRRISRDDAFDHVLGYTVCNDVTMRGFQYKTHQWMTSQFTRPEAGDVILTGTPGGVGYRRDPQVFLTDGDVVEVEIEAIGVLRNTVQAEA